jgi:hypothetical protein
MTPEQLARIWSLTSLFLVYYVLNAWLVSQGGSEVFGAKLIAEGRVLPVVTAIPIGSMILIITSSVGRLYAARQGAKWHERVPVVGFEKITTGSREGKTYQAVMFGTFSVLPWLGMIHFCSEALDAKVVTTDSTRLISLWDWSVWEWWKPFSGGQPALMCERYIDDPLPKCEHGFTMLPGLEPALFALLIAAAVFAAIRHWIAILR